MFDWITGFQEKKQQIEQLQYDLDRAERALTGQQFLIVAMELELDGNFELAIKYYQECINVESNAKADVHIAICLAAMGRVDEAKSMLEEIRHRDANYESAKVGRLLEEGYFGEPDYQAARRWYMAAAWGSPNNERVIIARDNLKRIMHEFYFEDYCCKCGKSLTDESIFFDNSTFAQDQEYCSSCIGLAPFIYELNSVTGEMKRATFNFS